MNVVLTLIDTVGIQSYIFGSNRLRENVGASYLVEEATGRWVYAELSELGAHNIADLKKGTIDPSRRIEEHQLAAELIYAGGGNTAILFASENNARRFTQSLSRRVLSKAPGLELVIVHSEPFEWRPEAPWPTDESTNLYTRLENLRDGRLKVKKRTRQVTSAAVSGLGVTAECQATGKVASQRSVGLEPEPRLLSTETIKKLEAYPPAEARLRELFIDTGFADADKFAFTDKLDHLGRKGGEESYIAVVHIDGNDLGRLIQEHVRKAATNREFIELMRNFSDGVKEASRTALVNTFRRLQPKPPNGNEGWRLVEVKPNFNAGEMSPAAEAKEIRLYHGPEKHYEGKPCWPFRPIVFGGDDVTFVCNGQLGLSLATIYMREFANETKNNPLLNKELHTGAGVCIVKVHYPFRRAYELSSSLMLSAKNALEDRKREQSSLDWHIATSGLGGNLQVINAREYLDGSLRMRPVLLSDHSKQRWNTWTNFNRLVASFNFHQDFAGRRNKLKALREVLRDGPDAVKSFLASTRTRLPKLAGAPSNLHELGWDGSVDQGRCGYFDALEAMDHHFLLAEVRDDGLE